MVDAMRPYNSLYIYFWEPSAPVKIFCLTWLDLPNESIYATRT